MTYSVKIPESISEIEKFRAGDLIYLSGIIYTGRDQAHKRITEYISENRVLPFSLENSAIFYVGPTPEKDGMVIGSAGPTTSVRMDSYSPILLDHGNKIMIGKGNRSENVIQSIVKNHAVYLAAIGGAGAYLSSCVKSSKVIAWPELGCEAVRELLVENMPLTVAIDSLGQNLYDIGVETYLHSVNL